MKIKTPHRLALRLLTLATRRGAKQEARAPRPFAEKEASGEDAVTSAPYQVNVAVKLKEWVDALVAAAVPTLHIWRGEVREQAKTARNLALKRDEAKAFVRDPLKLGGEGNAMVIALVLAAAVSFAITYDFVEESGWPIAVTLIATLALVTLEIAVTALVGWGVASLVLDKPGSPHDLEPKERTEVLVRTVALGFAVLVFVVVLGYERGSLVWVLAALLGGALGAFLGAAACEAKFHRAHDKLADETADEEKKETDLREGFYGFQRQVWETGQWLLDEAERILARGDAAFLKEFRAQHRNDGELPPAIPQPELLDAAVVRERLTVSLDEPATEGQLLELAQPRRDVDEQPAVPASHT